MGKAIFFICLTALSALLTVGLYQVPQPWRGILVGWLLFVVTLGAMILRLARHYFAYKSLQLTTQRAGKQPPARKEAAPRNDQLRDLRVVMSASGGGGRRVVR